MRIKRPNDFPTSEHDADSPVQIREPRFAVAEHEDYPLIVVTHEVKRQEHCESRDEKREPIVNQSPQLVVDIHA